MEMFQKQGKCTVPLVFKALERLFKMEKQMDGISLFDLPEKQFRVKLCKEFKEQIFASMLEKHSSFSGIAKAFGLKRGETARRYFIGRSGIPLSLLAKISQEVKISEGTLQKNVIELKTIKSKESIKNPKLPFKITPEFALVVGGVLGDGGIEKKKCRVWYFNDETEQIESFIKAVKSAFGDVGLAFHRSISGTPCVIFPRAIGLILKAVGLQDGNKNYQISIGVPKLILDSSNKKFKIALLRRLFDDDGTVVNHHNNRCVSFTAPKIVPKGTEEKEPQILVDIKKILEEFGITSNIVLFCRTYKENGEITLSWEIRIRGKENLQRFHDKIGFGMDRKQQKLHAVLSRYVEGLEFYPRHEAGKHYLEKIRTLAKRNIMLTAKNIARFCKRNDRHVRETLKNLTSKGLLYRELKGNKFVYAVRT